MEYLFGHCLRTLILFAQDRLLSLFTQAYDWSGKPEVDDRSYAGPGVKKYFWYLHILNVAPPTRYSILGKGLSFNVHYQNGIRKRNLKSSTEETFERYKLFLS